MPIRILSLPVADLQYALSSMNTKDLIALSLCSKRTKSLVKASNREIEGIVADVHENRIRVRIGTSRHEIVFLNIFDSQIELGRNGKEVKFWRKQEFTKSDWIPHFLSIFHESMIHQLDIKSVSLSYLDTIKQIIPKFRELYISEECSTELTKIAFLKLSHIAVKKVVIEKNLDGFENDVSEFLTLNLEFLRFTDSRFELKSEDLLVTNISILEINTIITERELNRFLKLWMKGNHTFYRPVEMMLRLENELNRDKVFKGINCEVFEEDENKSRLKRRDGKKLLCIMESSFIVLFF